MKTTRKKRSYQQGARAEAAEATGQRIVDAFFDRMFTQWYDEITLEQVAKDAGVTVMTVVRRFGGKETLLGEAVKKFSQQVAATREKGDGKIASIVDHLLDDYERSGDMVSRMLALEGRHEAIAPVLKVGRWYHRQWVSATFEKHLAGVTGEAKEKVIDALVIANDVYTWKLLRRDMKKTREETAEAMRKLIQAVLSEFVK
jgi:AcrR family transcriptional regulator